MWLLPQKYHRRNKIKEFILSSFADLSKSLFTKNLIVFSAMDMRKIHLFWHYIFKIYTIVCYCSLNKKAAAQLRFEGDPR